MPPGALRFPVDPSVWLNDDSEALLYQLVNRTVDVRHFGAKANGIADDTTAILSATASCIARGGGTVFFPPGVYLINTRTSNSLLYINGSKVTLQGAPGAVLKTTLNATGYCEMLTVGPSLNQLIDPFAQTVRALTGSYSAGVTSVTLATPSDAGNFTLGDYVLIRTGQVLDPGVGNPDGELNKVAAADAGTGIVTLAWPTTKPYQQEYYVSGTSGLTSTSVTANPAPYGLAKVTASTISDVAVRGLKLVSVNDGYWGLGGGAMIDGFELTDCQYDGSAAGMGSPGRRRWSKLLRNRAATRNTGGNIYYHFATDTCVTDCEIVGNTAIVEDGVSNVHVHEGSANVTVRDNLIYSKNVSGDKVPISVRARAYNIKINDNTVIGGGTTYGLFVDASCDGGGIIDGNTFVGGFGTAIAVTPPNWTVGIRNRPINGDIQFFESVQSPIHRLNNTVTPSRTTALLGKLPAYSMVLAVYLWVEEAFNSSGTDQISVGYSGSQQAIAPNADVSAGGRIVPAITAGLNRVSRDLNAYYTAGGSAPSTGKVVVVVEYCRVRDAYS